MMWKSHFDHLETQAGLVRRGGGWQKSGMRSVTILAAGFAWLTAIHGADLPEDPHFAPYRMTAVPETGPLLLEKGDRLAICGDSITEQKRYSLIIETYLAACMPELEVECRQSGWSGEQAGGFAARMASDVLRFQPDVATTCYGMNDFRYVPFDPAIAEEYRRHQGGIADAFSKAGCELVMGSPGIIDAVPHWVKTASGTQPELNLALCRFRNLGAELAAEKGLRFADVYRPMLVADWEAKRRHGVDFKVAGKDGVHPGWAGHLVMAHVFLRALGLDGDLGGIVMEGGGAVAHGGHEVSSFHDGTLGIRSRRLPFAAGPGDPANDDHLRAGLALVPFDAMLNRFTLSIASPAAARYEVTWGAETRQYEAARLEAGVNLAADFIEHPLLAPFRKVWAAAEAKQAYETRQLRQLMHGPEGAADMEATVALTEKVREELRAKLDAALQPVDHTITVRALP